MSASRTIGDAKAHHQAAWRGLSRERIEFESTLVQVPIVKRLLEGNWRAHDYRSLLVNLRQQVIEGSRWISRAASNLSPEHEDLRSMFVRHAVAEHRDFRLLEDNYVAAGGRLEEIQNRPKNIGSEAFSAFMYHTASKPDPLGMLGAMFIIEGLGERMAGEWAALIQSQLDLPDKAVSFLAYHGENDSEHIAMFEHALKLAATSAERTEDIVRHARVVARLYRLQLEELDNV